MKKILTVAAVLILTASTMFGQMLQGTGVKNTLSTTFGRPYGELNDGKREDVHYYGFINTLQARVDISKVTMEGMLNWGALTWADKLVTSFTFVNTEITPFWYTNHFDEGGWWTNGNAESYYVNFLAHPIQGLDIGMGTRLAWKVGPAPASHGNYWEPIAHIVQGGLKDAAPGKADVVGFTYYANSYTAYYNGNTKAALGARYRYNNLFEIGIALPSGVTADSPVFNFGLMLHPIDNLSIAVSYDGILQDSENFYTGLTFGANKVLVEAWFGLNMRGDGNTLFPTIENAGRWGTGLALTFNFAKIGMSLRPEAGITVYNYSDYTPATYAGARMDWAFAKNSFVFGAWSSLAWGSYDLKWHDETRARKAGYNYEKTKNYYGGFIFDVRPDLTWNFNANNSFTLFFDYQNRSKFDKSTYDVWASGLYWTTRN